MNLLFRNIWKTLKRYKVASILNILGLSIAFCVFAVIMIQVRYDLTYDNFHSKADRVFRTETRVFDPDLYTGNINRPLLRHIEETYPEVEATTFLSGNGLALMATEDRPGQYVNLGKYYSTTPDIFKLFDFEIIQGDMAAFRVPGQMMMAESQARQLFPDRPAVGQLLIPQGHDSVRYEVVAVYRDFPKNSYLKNALYTPIGTDNYENKRNWSYQGFVLLSGPNEREKVEDEINVYLHETDVAKKGTDWENGKKVFRLTSLPETHYVHDVSGDDIEKTNKGSVYSLVLIALLILVIAVINFVNFSMALVPARIRGINTRKVLGEPVAQMRWGQISEAIALCLLAVIVALAGIHLLSGSGVSSLLSADISVSRNIPILTGTVIIALVTGLVAGIFPAVYQSSFPPALVLKGSFGLSPKGKKVRTVLISFQYIISFGLIVVALFIREQNQYLRDFPLGMDKEYVLSGPIWEGVLNREEMFLEEVKKNPAVKEVAFTYNGMILSEGGNQWGRKHKGEDITFNVISVSRDFIPAMGIRVSDGRNFLDSDLEKPGGALIFNETARQQFGLQVNEVMVDAGGETIVGFVEDFHFRPLHYAVGPVAFVFRDQPRYFSMGYFRIDSRNVQATMEYLTEIIHRMDPERAEVSGLKFMDEWIGELYQREQRMAELITLFSLMAVLISIMGVFGLVMFEAQYRRKEIGLRRISGATVTQILELLNRGFVRIVLICFILSVPVAYWFIRRWLEQFAYKSPVEWWIFAVSLVSILLITMLTVTLQSYRAATENPVNSIKTE